MTQGRMTAEELEMGEKRERDLMNDAADALYEKGFEDPEAKTLLIRWVEAKEYEVRLMNSNPSKAQIELGIEVAWLYSYAGRFKEALAELQSIEEAAWNEDDNHELYKKIIEREDEIKQTEGFGEEDSNSEG